MLKKFSAPCARSHQLSRSRLPAKGRRWGWGPAALIKERARPEWADGGKPSEERGAKRANEECPPPLKLRRDLAEAGLVGFVKPAKAGARIDTLDFAHPAKPEVGIVEPWRQAASGGAPRHDNLVSPGTASRRPAKRVAGGTRVFYRGV